MTVLFIRNFDKELHRQLNIEVARRDEGITQKVIIEEALREYLEKKKGE